MGFLCLAVQNENVIIVPQYNTFLPQIRYYSLDDLSDRASIHILFRFLTLHYAAPRVKPDGILYNADFAQNLSRPVVLAKASLVNPHYNPITYQLLNTKEFKLNHRGEITVDFSRV